jgi:PAS domain S-box-containing protein
LPVKALFQFIAAAPGEVLAVGWVDVLELIGLQQQLIRFNNEVSAVARATLKESQFAMGRQADTHRRILEAADEGIYALDREGCYSLVNPAAATQLGYRADELLGMNRLDTWRSHDADGRAYPDAECPIADTLANGVPHTDDGRYFQRKDGSIFPVTFSSHPLMDRRRIAGVVVTFRDITRRQQEESAPLRAGGNAGAAKLARRAVLSSISHELRAPMNAILGMADILRRSGLDPLQADCLAKIEMAGNQLLRAVDDMLDRSASEEQPFDDAPAGPGQGTSPAD